MGISLTAGMRSNLFSLQQTSQLMDQTQLRLNTGKKVNSALDDPTSYFTARSHTSRANELSQLKNGMSEAIQTITAANAGIESMISLLESAKATAETAQAAGDTTSNVSQTISLNGVSAGDTIDIGGQTYTITDGTVGGYNVAEGASDDITAMNLATFINSNNEGGIGNVDATSVTGTTITLEISNTDMVDTSVENASSSFSESALIAANDDLSTLASQYNTLLSQIDDLSNDSGYKGINLLGADNLTVNFEGNNELQVNGFNADVDQLGGTNKLDNTRTGADWGSGTSLSDDVTSLKNAIDELESQQSNLASSLNIVKSRQSFTEEMINTLQTGADNLTLADMNEEGANMLMLQTQQTLGTTSLSMAAQAAQSVLRLF